MWKSIYLRIIVLKFNMFLVKVSSWWNKKFIFNDLFLSSNYIHSFYIWNEVLCECQAILYSCQIVIYSHLITSYFRWWKTQSFFFLFMLFVWKNLQVITLLASPSSIWYLKKSLCYITLKICPLQKKISNCFLISLFFIHFTLPMYVSNELLLDRFFSPADDVRRLT